jgi:hypothetical protein
LADESSIVKGPASNSARFLKGLAHGGLSAVQSEKFGHTLTGIGKQYLLDEA